MKRIIIVLFLLCCIPIVKAQEAVFEEADCPFGEYDGYTIDCGYLIVPEDRADPNSRDIRLAVAIVRAENPLPDPIIYLEGGPGGSALYGIDGWLDFELLENRDFILIDQRGTGYSDPRLVCPEGEEYDDMETDEYADACREVLERQNIDLAMYTSANSAADIADLRKALGYEQVNLYGISYGTRLALTVMRDHPEGIRSVVLDSSYPPQVAGYDEMPVNAYRAFSQLFAGCAANLRCNRAYPNLENVFYEVVEQGNDESFTVDLGDGEEEWSGDDFMLHIFEEMYATDSIPYLPAAIYQARDGDFDILSDLAAGIDESGSEEDGPYEEDAMLEVFDELLADYLDYDDIDEMYDDIDNMSDDEYYGTVDEFIDEMSDDDFEYLLMVFTGYDDEDDFYEYYDDLSDDEYDALYDDFLVSVYGEEGGYYEDVSDSDAMYNSVECYEEIPSNDIDRAEDLSESLPDLVEEAFMVDVRDQFTICEEWGVPAAGAIETQVVRSDIPTMVFAGTYDPITPPSWGKAAAEGLSHVYYFEFPGVGHSAIDGGDCPIEIAIAFIDNPNTEPDSRCIGEMSAPDFYIED